MHLGYVQIAKGTMNKNDKVQEVILYFSSNKEFIVYNLNNPEEIYLKGTYINEWLDVELTITENNIDDKTTMNLVGEQVIYR